MTKAGYYRESESREFDSEMANPTRYSQESREIRLFFFYSNHEIRKVGFPDSRICPYSNRPKNEVPIVYIARIKKPMLECHHFFN